MFIDVHCHLDMIEGISLDDVQNRAKGKNVKIVWAGVNPETNREIISEKNFKGKRCLGLYPIDALALTDEGIDEEIEFIRKHKGDIVGIGEIGLDFKEDSENWERQESIFRKLLKLSKEIDKPVVIHSRKAEKKCIEILEEEKAKKVIMHVFSGKLKLVERVVKNGWSLSIPTSVKNSEHFQKVISMTPIEQLFCETDSPYLHPDRQFPNTPDNVIVSYEKIAEIKGLGLEEVERQLEENWLGFC